MAFNSQAVQDLSTIVRTHGIPYSMQLYTGSPYNEYGEETPTASGTVITGSLVVFPLGKTDRQYVEQGLLTAAERKVFIGSMLSANAPNESAVLVFGAGSYSIIPGMLWNYDVEGATVYYKAYVKVLV